MKSLRESLFDSKIQTMESLFDKDLIEKDLPTFKEVFEFKKDNSDAGICGNQFSFRRLKKDIGAPGKDEEEIIFNSIVKIIEDIKMNEIYTHGIEESISEALSPYVLSRWKPLSKRNGDVFVWDGKLLVSSNLTTQQKLNWDRICISILSVSLRFERK